MVVYNIVKKCQFWIDFESRLIGPPRIFALLFWLLQICRSIKCFRLWLKGQEILVNKCFAHSRTIALQLACSGGYPADSYPLCVGDWGLLVCSCPLSPLTCTPPAASVTEDLPVCVPSQLQTRHPPTSPVQPSLPGEQRPIRVLPTNIRLSYLSVIDF